MKYRIELKNRLGQLFFKICSCDQQKEIFVEMAKNCSSGPYEIKIITL